MSLDHGTSYTSINATPVVPSSPLMSAVYPPGGRVTRIAQLAEPLAKFAKPQLGVTAKTCAAFPAVLQPVFSAIFPEASLSSRCGVASVPSTPDGADARMITCFG